jgi:hypothetical protein
MTAYVILPVSGPIPGNALKPQGRRCYRGAFAEAETVTDAMLDDVV